MTDKTRKPVIGVLVSGILDDFTEQLCQGVMTAAETRDLTVVVIPGKYLDRDVTRNPGIMYEYQYNTLFSYAAPENVDALLVAADCIGCLTTRDRLCRLMETYRGIPTVLIASKLEGYPNISYENGAGIRDGMDYLIRVLGCRRFGMIGGPDDNFDAAERKQTFLQVLEEHGIAFSPEAYIQGELTGCSEEQLADFLDRNPDLEAVVCVNDDTALGFYEALHKKGKVPGRDISVLGFDDSKAATKATPPLSSVSASPAALGQQALLSVLQLLEGKEVESILLPTKFIRRHSFCSVPETAENGGAQAAGSLTPDRIYDAVFYRYDRDVYQNKMAPVKAAGSALLDSILQRFSGSDSSAGSDGAILNHLNAFVDAGALRYADIDNLLSIFEQGYRLLAGRQTDPNRKQELEDLFFTMHRTVIRSMNAERDRLIERHQSQNYSMRLFVHDILTFEKGNDQSYCHLLWHLNWMNINNAFLYVYEKPILHLNGERFVPPDRLCLKAVFRDGAVSMVPSLKQSVSVKDLYRNDFMDPDKRYRLVLLPLFSSEMLYGLLLCDLADSIYEDGEFMVNQMASAAKMIYLLLNNEQIQQQLEDNLVTLRENNIVLDALSKSDGLTGILNRRGFEDSAEHLLSLNRSAGRETLVVYVDMNNLKIINDRYGHEEGDFSLHLIAGILSGIMKDMGGIAGRIGGDEFACAVTYEGEDDGRDLLDHIYGAFDSFNRTSSKSYNITVSAGCCLVDSAGSLSLAEALSTADEQLYHVKHLRTREVEKKFPPRIYPEPACSR